jgi:hypothetical protein
VQLGLDELKVISLLLARNLASLQSFRLRIAVLTSEQLQSVDRLILNMMFAHPLFSAKNGSVGGGL